MSSVINEKMDIYNLLTAEEKKELQEIELQLESFSDDQDSKIELKVALIGEVKAGKSTLMNALVGKNVAPTGIMETTSIVMEIRHSNSESAILTYKEGASKTLPIQDAYNLLLGSNTDQTFFNQLTNVQIMLPLEEMKNLILIDTPGLGTITKENEQRTLDYLCDVDIVLWVVNVTHLGQADINEFAQKVAGLGKRLVVVANKYDLVANDISAEDIEYEILWEQDFSFYSDRAIAISSLQAEKAILSNDRELLNISRISLLQELLEKELNSNYIAHKFDALSLGKETLIQKRQNWYKKINNRISRLVQSFEYEKELINISNNRIKRQIDMQIKDWADKDFFVKESLELREALNKGEYDIVEKLAEIYLDETYIETKLATQIEKFYKNAREYWEMETEEIKEKLGERFIVESQHEELYSLAGDNMLSETVVTGGKEGALYGGAAGLAFATYAAVLGPAAAYISMGAALSAVFLPMVAVGAVSGVGVKIFQKMNKGKKYQEQVEITIDQVTNSVLNSLPTIQENLDEYSNDKANELIDRRKQDILGNISYRNVTDFLKKIQIYTSEKCEVKV